jgi:nucleoside-diphosphate-sugar epimerase
VTRVLVTGATGFIAGHCIEDLLAHGYAVRGTVRDTTTADVVHLEAIARRTGGALEFVPARLDRDDGWAEAVDGCDRVLHVASPFPPANPVDADELIRPAVDGTLRVLRAAAASGTVRRVALTSSIAAIIAGHDPTDGRVHTEADWTEVERAPAYQQSKTYAERAAWAFAAEHPELELVVLNPGMVIGPLQHTCRPTSIEVLRRLLNREMPALPRMGWSTVDVRDVAAAHRLAIEVDQAKGNRYILAGDHVWTRDIALVLAEEFEPLGYRLPTRDLPYWLMWTIARFDRTVRFALGFVGRRELVSADRARRELGWTMRPVDESIKETGHSLIRYGVVKPRRGTRPVTVIS